MAEALFEAMGGAGGIVALGGILSNVPAIERKNGLDEALAENPEVELLDFQVANWDPNQAYDITSAWVTRFGDEIKGIWAANDGMGIAALEVLRAEGMAGQVPVTGIDGIQLAVEAVIARRVRRHGRLGPVLAGQHGALDPLSRQDRRVRPGGRARGAPRVLRQRHRDHQGQRARVLRDNIKSTPELDFSDLWGRVSGQIQYE